MTSEITNISKSMPLKIIYYITSHGFGHATRSSEIIEELAKRNHWITITTNAPSFLFAEILSERVTLRPCALEPPIVQINACTLDPESSMTKLETWLEQVPEIQQTEQEFLKLIRPDVILLDSGYVAAPVAKKLSIPTILISNFTFDRVYSALARNDQDKKNVGIVTEMYYSITHFLRMHGWIECSVHAKPIDVPLVVRMPRQYKQEVLQKLSIPTSSKVCLVSFGGHDFFKECKLVLPEGWIGIIIGPGISLDHEKLICVNTQDWFLPDLVNASDVVLSKWSFSFNILVVMEYAASVLRPGLRWFLSNDRDLLKRKG